MDWLTASMWVPGNQVVPQQPFGHDRSWMQGGSVTFSMVAAEEISWFQCPIPTPTRLPGIDNRVQLSRFMLLFRAAPSVTINRIDFYDWGAPGGQTCVVRRGPVRRA